MKNIVKSALILLSIGSLFLQGCEIDCYEPKEKQIQQYFKMSCEQSVQQKIDGKVTITLLNSSKKLLIHVDEVLVRLERPQNGKSRTLDERISVLKVLRPLETYSHEYSIQVMDEVKRVMPIESAIKCSCND